MPRPRDAFEDVRPLAFRDPDEVLDPDRMYTVYEISRLLQGLAADRELDPETEAILLDWAIPWMMVNADALAFAEPAADDEPGYYGLREGADDGEQAGASPSVDADGGGGA
jgi:hypothetical protein